MSRIMEAHMEGRYPESPGFKEPTTSREAAEKIAPSTANLQAKVLAAIVAAGDDGLTADEAAEKCGLDVLTCRPRVTELRARGKIKKSGKRRPSSTGTPSAVWVANDEN